MTMKSYPSISELLEMGAADLANHEIAVVNLACAVGLPGAEDLRIPACLATLEQWTAMVRRYTDEGLADYEQDPHSYERHPGFFRFVAMVTILRHPRGLNIQYQPRAIGNFVFRDSRDDLLHGVLTRRLGTCASLPVLYFAIGRRLGYPMHLAIGKNHVLCQWVNDDGSRINLEGSNAGGGEMPPDEHYHHWPYPMTRDELASGRYLRPLTRSEEFALFLETRGHCLADNGRFDQARTAYQQAHRVSNGWSPLEGNLDWLAMLERQAIRRGRKPRATPFSNTPLMQSAGQKWNR